MALRARARAVPGGRVTAQAIDASALAHRIVDVASDKKASDIVLLEVSALTTIADYFVICSSQSERQVQAVAEAIIEAGENDGRAAIGIEGLSAARWVLVDFGDVIVHVFTPDERAYYRLERLWGDAPIVVRVQ